MPRIAVTRLSTSSCDPDPIRGVSMTVSFMSYAEPISAAADLQRQGITSQEPRVRSRFLQPGRNTSRYKPSLRSLAARLTPDFRGPHATSQAFGLCPVLSGARKPRPAPPAAHRSYDATRLYV